MQKSHSIFQYPYFTNIIYTYPSYKYLYAILITSIALPSKGINIEKAKIPAFYP